MQVVRLSIDVNGDAAHIHSQHNAKCREFQEKTGHIVMISEEKVVVEYVANKAKKNKGNNSIVLYSSS